MIDIGMRDKLFIKYDEYVKTFQRDGKLGPMLQLKFAHSKRVAENARQIADYNGFSENMVVLAEVCGLFHDIGRYRQLEEFGTFRDADSINHGECGFEVLLELGWLEVLPAKARDCILKSTRYHNALHIPDQIVDETILTFLKLVRDSDKLDIYYVFYDAINNNNLEKYPEIVHNLEVDAEPTPEIVDAILEDPFKPISYLDAKSMIDFLLIPIQWSYDLHSFGSYKILIEKNLLQHMKDIIPLNGNEKVERIIDNALLHAQLALEEHLR